MKYSESTFTIDKKYAGELENEIDVFLQQTNTKKSISITMVTTFGIKKNEYESRMVQHSFLLTRTYS